MSWQLFDRLAAFFKQSNLYRQDSLFIDQTSLDRITSGGRFLNFAQQNVLLEQTNLQINRLERYKDFDQMSEVGEVQMALNIYASECSLLDPELKHAITIKAKSSRVKKELEKLFYETLLIDNRLRPLCRYLIKYGDFPAEIITTKNRNGVMNFKHMNVYNFTRIETKYGDLVGFFFQDQLTAEPVFLHPWQVMHLRLTSFENIYHPYGMCSEFGTRVLTPSGYKNIEDFKAGDDVYVYYNNKLVPTKVTASCRSGEKEIYRIKTKHFQNDCSGNHPILVRRWINKPFKFGNKWFADLVYKRADELIVGDELVIPKVDDSKKEYQILGDVKGDVIKGDEKFARLFGFLIGDGWLQKRYNKNVGVQFALGEYEDRNKRYTKLLDEYSPNKTIRYNSNFKSKLLETTTRTCSVDLSDFIEKNCGFIQGCKNKRIPLWVYNSPRSVKIAFINGLLDADGSSNIDEWDCDRLQIELANYELIKDIKMLIHDIGWKCGQILKRNRPSDVVTFHGQEYDISDAWYIYFYRSDLFADAHKNYRFRGGARRKECEKFGNNVLFEPIISIEKDGFHPTADIQVDHQASNFVANGVVIHNSKLDGARKHFKQLRLMEDAALIYRITRAPEKRVFTIPVGNIPTPEVEAYIENIARQFKKKQFFDPASGDVNERWHPLIQEDDFWLPQRCLSEGAQTYIIEKEDKMLSNDSITSMNSKKKTLKELVNEYGHMDKEFWVYSYDENSGRIVPAKAKACISPKNQQMVRVTIDNNESIECTPDHKFMTRDGKWVEAQDLQSGQSLMPLYRRNKVYYGKSDYEQVLQPDGKWEWTHKVALPKVPKNHVRHHKDFDRFNNSPDNLEKMHFVEHRKLHQEYAVKMLTCMTEEERRLGTERGIVKWNNENPKLRKEVASKGSIKAWKDGKYDHIKPRDHKDWVDIEDYKDKWKELILNTGSVRAAVRTWNDDPDLRHIWKANHNVLKEKIIEQWGYNSVEVFAGIKIKLPQNYKHLYVHGDNIRTLVEAYGPSVAAQKWNADSNNINIWKATIRGISKVAKLFGYNGSYVGGKKLQLSDKQVLEKLRSYNAITQFLRDLLKDGIKIHNDTVTRILKRNGYSSFREFKKTNNHKVVSVEWLEEKQDTYCLVVPETKCFFLAAGVLVHNSDGTGPTITTLPGAENLDDIKDIEYFKKKMISALQIPFEWVGLGEGSGSQERPLAAIDPMFAKEVQWIQREIAVGLKKIAIVHLALAGFKEADMHDFDIRMASSSAIDELYRIETWQSRANVIESLRATEYFTKKWILKRFTDMTDEEIDELDEEVANQQEAMPGMEQDMGMGMGGALPPPPDEELPPGEPVPLDVGGLGAPPGGPPPGLPEDYDADLERQVLLEYQKYQDTRNQPVVKEEKPHIGRSLYDNTNHQNIHEYASGYNNMLNTCELDGLSTITDNGEEEVLVESVVEPGEAAQAKYRARVLLTENMEVEDDNNDEIVTIDDLPSRMASQWV